jgi:phage/plasmid-associated DNA primase
MGNAKRFLFVFKDEVFYNRQQNCWYYNNQGKWVMDDVMMIELYAQATVQLYETASKNGDDTFKKHASQSLNSSAIKNLLDMAKANAIISYSKFDNKPYLLNVRNGVINLKNGRLKNVLLITIP